MSTIFDITNMSSLLNAKSVLNSQLILASNSSNNNDSKSSNNESLILKAPQLKDIRFFNESGPAINQPPSPTTKLTLTSRNSNSLPAKINVAPILADSSRVKIKKKVTFPEDEKIIKDYSEPPRRGWIPGSYSTSDLLDAYLRSCERHKCKPLNRLMPQLKALQDLDCANGEKVNVLNLKNEKLDSRQMEALEEVFKRLSFKTIDLETSQFDDDLAGATLFDILEYYDTCERLILANNRSISLFGWQSLTKFIRKSGSLEYIDLRAHTFPELIYFTYLARSIRLTLTLRVVHLEFSNIQGRLLLMLATALKDNEQIKEVYLADNKIQPSDGQSIAAIIKDNKCLELLDLRNNNLQDIGLSYVCSGLSEQIKTSSGLKSLVLSNNNITANGVSYLSKALIHNRSLISLSIGHNTLANEAIYELKEALIVNKQIECIFLNKIKLGDEGVIALAEYIAESETLTRLDLRDNDIRLGGLMALASALKINKTLSRIDLDREPKKENSIKDSLETSKRLLNDINEYCARNKRSYNERQLRLREEEENRKLEASKKDDESIVDSLLKEIDESLVREESANNNNKRENNVELIEATRDKAAQSNEDEIDLIDDDVLLKKILNRNFASTPSILSPLNDDLINYFTIDKEKKLLEESSTDAPTNNDENYDFQIVDNNDMNVVKDADLDLVILRSNKSVDTKSHRLITTNCGELLSSALDNDVIEVANNLVEAVIKNAEKFLIDKEEKVCENVVTEENAPTNDMEESGEKAASCLLSSISEQEVEYLINGHNKLITSDLLNESDSSNYDLLNEPNSALLITPESLPDSPQVNLLSSSYELDEAEEQTSFLDESFEAHTLRKNIELLSFSSTPSPQPTQQLEDGVESFIESIHCLDLVTKSKLDASSKPFFDSQLTNSQLSEELTHEIQLTCDN